MHNGISVNVEGGFVIVYHHIQKITTQINVLLPDFIDCVNMVAKAKMYVGHRNRMEIIVNIYMTFVIFVVDVAEHKRILKGSRHLPRNRIKVKSKW